METTMKHDLTFVLDADRAERLATFGELLNKDTVSMINEAMDLYFETKEDEIAGQDPMTNLSYDEFWDDLDLE